MENAIDFNKTVDFDNLDLNFILATLERWNRENPESRKKSYDSYQAYRAVIDRLIAGAEQTQLRPAYKALTAAPAGLGARVGKDVLPVIYLADCGASGGQCMKHMVIHGGAWSYAEDLPEFLGLVMR